MKWRNGVINENDNVMIKWKLISMKIANVLSNNESRKSANQY